ncbi:MAG: bifunctional DNA primase/polymerase [Alphaproteobacteria bacterium]|nr:bifunctional DNA primase/polymerase [Alphaproteobacteria bacterium]
MKSNVWGAKPEDWAFFSDTLGLTADLLPVVSVPGAKISPKSTMKQLGKTPSVYNKEGEVVGLGKWTERTTTHGDIDRWSREDHYGICLQTRNVRALDIDVADNDKAVAIGFFIAMTLKHLTESDISLPLRYRANSGKRVTAFRLDGTFTKRTLKVEGGMIEFLATGQQFIVAGTHPSGVRYEWTSFEEFPVVSAEDLEALWYALELEFGIAESTIGGVRKRADNQQKIVTDDVVKFLEENGHVIEYGPEGQAHIECPFADQHTTESAISSTSYFPAGSRGYERGHFSCLHAHCQDRDDTQFLDAFGFRASHFDAVTAGAQSDGEIVEQPWPRLERDKQGRILATIENLQAVLMRPDICGEYIRFDNFRDEIMFSPVLEPGGWRPFKDTDYTRLRVSLALKGFKPIAKELMRDVVHRVAELSHFDTAIEWLQGIKWDGKPRIKYFLRDYFGAADDEYAQSVSLYLWTAFAGRVLDPGCKADMVPVLIGRQGVGKTYGVSEMVPGFEHFESIDLMARDADLSRRMRGKLVIEIGELRGLHSRDMETIKEFITRTHESWVPKYQEFAQKYPRRCVFVGTTNKDEFLADTTGNRRWLPVRCSKVDVAGVRRDREQLWAEGRELFNLLGGVAWHEAQGRAEEIHDDHRMTDVWAEEIDRYLCEADDVDGGTPLAKGYVTTGEILRFALGFDLKTVRRGDEMRVADILREIGLTRKTLRVEGRLAKVWEKKR